MPPLAVKIPLEMFIPSISSGEVSNLTKMHAIPFLARILASSVEKTHFPTAAPGEAPNPFPSGLWVFLIFSGMTGYNN